MAQVRFGKDLDGEQQVFYFRGGCIFVDIVLSQPAMNEPPLLVPEEHAHDLPLFYLAYYNCVVVIGAVNDQGGTQSSADVAMLAHRNGVCLLAPICTGDRFASVEYHVSTAAEKSAGGMKKRLNRHDPNLLRAGDLLATVTAQNGSAQNGSTIVQQVQCPVRCKLVELNTERLEGCATDRWHQEGWLAVVQLPEHELPAVDGVRVMSLPQYAALRGLPEGCFDWLSKALNIVKAGGDET